MLIVPAPGLDVDPEFEKTLTLTSQVKMNREGYRRLGVGGLRVSGLGLFSDIDAIRTACEPSFQRSRVLSDRPPSIEEAGVER